MGCIEASEYTTGTILGVHGTLEECEEQCGVCCVPSCAAGWPNSFLNEVPQFYDEANTCSQFAYAELRVGDSPRAPYYDGQTQPIPWKPGYPAALNGLDWKWVTSRTYKNANWGGNGTACASVEGLSEPISVYEYDSKTVLLVCIDGTLTDITSDAVDVELFKVDSVRSAGAPESGECFPPFACNDYTGECGTSYNILEHQYTEGNGACDGGFIIIKMGGSADWQVDPGPRPPLPNEQNADVVFNCDDGLTRSQCDGVGTWISGQTCATFDCNA